jgi:hypothetical protein
MVAVQESKDLQQNSLTKPAFRSALKEGAKKVAIERQKNPYDIHSPSKSTVDRYRKRIVPDTVIHPSTQNTRRMEVHVYGYSPHDVSLSFPQVAMDIRNQLSLCAVGGAFLEDSLAELTFNTDMTSIYLEDKVERVYLAKGSAAKLKEENKSASATTDSTQKRTVNMLSTVSAAGNLLCTVVCIKDTENKILTTTLVQCHYV